MLNGIDVSSHQGIIDWDAVKQKIDFAIIRCGYGDDISKQDDKQFFKNASECERLNIPYGVYLYSYATDNEHLNSEISHVKRMINGKNPFCVYFDMEDKSTVFLGKQTLTEYALKFCNSIKSAGYKTGVYANQNWFQNYLDVAAIYKSNNSIWCAKYSDNKPNINAPYDIWQYTSKGSMEGISSSGLDLNYMYNDILNDNNKPTNPQVPEKLDVIYQIWDDVNNRWLPNVVNNSDYAGIYGHDVCCVYANLSKGNIIYAVHFKGGKWLPSVKNRSDYAGLFNKPIDAIMIKTDTGKKLNYRAHLRRKDYWLPTVTGYSTDDSINGYAGIIGQEIDGIQIWFN